MIFGLNSARHEFWPDGLPEVDELRERVEDAGFLAPLGLREAEFLRWVDLVGLEAAVPVELEADEVSRRKLRRRRLDGNRRAKPRIAYQIQDRSAEKQNRCEI